MPKPRPHHHQHTPHVVVAWVFSFYRLGGLLSDFASFVVVETFVVLDDNET